MKSFLQWRNYVLFLLFAVGLLGVALPFGDPVKPMTQLQWLLWFAAPLAVGIASFLLSLASPANGPSKANSP